MDNKFHKIQFFFNQDESLNTLNVYHNIEIISDVNELYAKNGGGGFSLYLGNSYLCLDVDSESKRVGNFGGIINFDNVCSENICLPENVLNGILYVKGEEFISGVNWRFEMCEKYVFDANQLLFQIGQYSTNEPCCRFLKNAYCQLDGQGNLKCLLISGIKLSK